MCTFKKVYFIKKETLAQVFPREFCEISKKTFFTEHLETTASMSSQFALHQTLVYFTNCGIIAINFVSNFLIFQIATKTLPTK